MGTTELEGVKERMEQGGERGTREVMDILELSDYLGIGKSKIYALIRSRKIPASRIGSQYRFSKSVIDAWLRESLITQPPEPQGRLFEPR